MQVSISLLHAYESRWLGHTTASSARYRGSMAEYTAWLPSSGVATTAWQSGEAACDLAAATILLQLVLGSAQ